ncbi:MAG: hypothetical protein ACR2RF_13310 [Geminicoccaceae bacterium]
MNKLLSRLAKGLAEYAGIIVLVLAFIGILFAAVSLLPPEPTPESVEMGALR